ncbi:hypothetical protein AC579_934 [Pseudocercospora musae]|uniref:Uncharacterized protein n=1 Tax=Pseudocercospora musae TaxID=113226 RepID=A0A139IUB3_9PEZI|nr:hypothetical protein AC579_934 [Pseudocercospora musae]
MISSAFAHLAENDSGFWLPRVDGQVLIISGEDFYTTIFEASCIYKHPTAVVIRTEAFSGASQRSCVDLELHSSCPLFTAVYEALEC